ncbi:MAG TPA: ATP-binding protein, partial [Dermatophilaceae bacterium]|nr:ATP-binding protein [Dermatophilaceae bacterium]
LADLARRSGPLVTVGALPQGRYDETVEVTAFYVAAESVTNALRHAPGATVEIGAVDHGDMLVVRVADDGPGGALIANRYLEEGSGLAGLRDRVSAVGGSLTVKSAPQRGTTVVARLPLSASAES